MEITLNRPEKHNVLDSSALRKLVDTFRKLEEKREIRVVIIKGVGTRAFCAGMDVHQFYDKTVPELKRNLTYVANLFQSLAKTPQPIIAAVNGLALGGGCGIVAASDLAYASENARFGLPEIELGLFPMQNMAPVYQSMGKKRVFSLLFRGKTISANEAREFGLINEIIPSDQDLVEIVKEIASELSKRNPYALQWGKEALYSMLGIEYLQSIKYLSNMMTLLTMTDEAQKNIKSFLKEKD